LFGLEQSSTGVPRIANRPLDRIVKLSLSNVEFIPNTMEDFSTRFDDIVGVSSSDAPGNLEHVVLKFDEDRYPYIVSKPIHHSQTIVNEKEHIVQIDVRPNKELKSLIFSFCPQVEVLSPDWLRQEIKEKIENNLKKYLTV